MDRNLYRSQATHGRPRRPAGRPGPLGPCAAKLRAAQVDLKLGFSIDFYR